MAAKAFLAIAPLLAIASAQGGATEYVDSSLGGLKFQQVQRSASGQGGIKFGIALPDTAGGFDFIGQLSGTGPGWAGVALGAPGMAGNLLVVASPAGTQIRGSLRMAQYNGYPPEYRGNATLKTIAQDATPGNWKYTFLCQGCLRVAKFKANSATANMGWAYHPSSPQIAKHPPGYAGSDIVISLAAAKSAAYAAAAAGASGAGAAAPVSASSAAPLPASGSEFAPLPAGDTLTLGLPSGAAATAYPPPPAATPLSTTTGNSTPVPAPAPLPLDGTGTDSDALAQPGMVVPQPGVYGPPWAGGLGGPWGAGPPPWAGRGGPWGGGPPPWAFGSGPPPWVGAGGPPFGPWAAAVGDGDNDGWGPPWRRRMGQWSRLAGGPAFRGHAHDAHGH